MQLPYLVENDLRLKTLGVYRCVIRTILDRSACPLRPRCKKSTGTCDLDKLTSWCWHNNDSTMTIMPNSTTLNSSPTKPLSGPACQVGSRDGASSQRHEQGGWPSIEHNVETMLYSCKSVVPSPAPFQMVDMLMVLLKTTTSAPSSSLSFSPHSFLTTPHTPDPLMDTASCQNSLLSTPSQHYPLLFLTLSRPQLPVCPSLYTSSFLPVPDPYNLYTSAPWWLLVEFMFLIAHLIMDFVSGLPQPHLACQLILIGMHIPHVLTNRTNRLTYFHLPCFSYPHWITMHGQPHIIFTVLYWHH